MKKETQQVNPYPIRLTPSLKKRLQKSAENNGRSLNAEMLLRLENSFISEEEEEDRFEKVVVKILDKMEKEGNITIHNKK